MYFSLTTIAIYYKSLRQSCNKAHLTNLFKKSCSKCSCNLKTSFHSIIDNALAVIRVFILDSYDFLHNLKEKFLVNGHHHPSTTSSYSELKVPIIIIKGEKKKKIKTPPNRIDYLALTTQKIYMQVQLCISCQTIYLRLGLKASIMHMVVKEYICGLIWRHHYVKSKHTMNFSCHQKESISILRSAESRVWLNNENNARKTILYSVSHFFFLPFFFIFFLFFYFFLRCWISPNHKHTCQHRLIIAKSFHWVLWSTSDWNMTVYFIHWTYWTDWHIIWNQSMY